jgi:para-aminobenzoate synthetase component 1
MVLLSGRGDPELTGWSYGALEPVEVLDGFGAAHRAVVPRASGLPMSGDACDQAQVIEGEAERFEPPPAPAPDGLPPFTTGAVGYLSYDAGWAHAARPRRPRPDPLGMPRERFHRYDAVYAVHAGTGAGVLMWEPGGEARARRLLRCLDQGPRPLEGALEGELDARVSRARHEARVEAALERIRAGEIYQVNLTYPLEGRFRGAPAAVLARLAERAPPFAAFLGVGVDQAVVSASPECFFDLRADGRIRTFPIKGTVRRSSQLEQDRALARRLALDPKERAEHLMIVDLLRNDLGRIASAGSVGVEGLAYVESFPTVHHLTSRVQAWLRPNLAPEDFARALLPGGSITGAPKLRAMETIDELEGEARGVYTGSLVWMDRGGAARASVAIRTAQIAGGQLRFGVGGGIVADSEPAREWEETVVKAAALGAALRGS